MSDTIISPNMSLPIPITGQDAGPDYANNVNASLQIVDGHTHGPGSGKPITPAAISINADLPFSNNNATGVRSVRFQSQGTTISNPSDLDCLTVTGVDLYYVDGNGNQIRITQGGSVAGSTGTITGLPSGTASAAYSAGKFIFQAATNTPANMDVASVIFRNNSAGSKGLTVSPPNAMGADYAITFPSLPGTQSIMTLDASGTMSAPYTVDNSTITISANVIGVPAGGITSTQLATNSVTTIKITDANVTTAKIADANVTTAKIADSNVTTAKIAANAVTASKLYAFNYALSSSSGAYTSGSTNNWENVTNLSVTLTVDSGRPVILTLVPDGSTNGANVNIVSADSCQFLKDGSTNVGTITPPTGSTGANPFTAIDFPTAASHTYSVRVFTATGSDTFNYVKLLAYQL